MHPLATHAERFELVVHATPGEKHDIHQSSAGRLSQLSEVLTLEKTLKNKGRCVRHGDRDGFLGRPELRSMCRSDAMEVFSLRGGWKLGWKAD